MLGILTKELKASDERAECQLAELHSESCEPPLYITKRTYRMLNEVAVNEFHLCAPAGAKCWVQDGVLVQVEQPTGGTLRSVVANDGKWHPTAEEIDKP